MNCDSCQKTIGTNPGDPHFVCACGHRYCWNCGFSRYKCDRCGQEQRITERRA